MNDRNLSRSGYRHSNVFMLNYYGRKNFSIILTVSRKIQKNTLSLCTSRPHRFPPVEAKQLNLKH